MIAFDASFLLDYLDGVPDSREYLEAHADEPHHAPTLALFDAYRGGARTSGSEGVDQVATALDWVEPLPLTAPAAREAAIIEAELLADGNRVNLGDTLIAGVCRQVGATLVTRDEHFDRVGGLDVVAY